MLTVFKMSILLYHIVIHLVKALISNNLVPSCIKSKNVVRHNSINCSHAGILEFITTYSF